MMSIYLERKPDGKMDRKISGRIDVLTDFPGKRHPKHCLGEMSDNIIACKHDCMCELRLAIGMRRRLWILRWIRRPTMRLFQRTGTIGVRVGSQHGTQG
jgi:hypothetical protein